MLEDLPLPKLKGPAWALFLDVDGTLLELADHPDKVVVPEELPDLLKQLRDGLGGAVALVSGRSLLTLDTLFGLKAFDAAGCHGAEFRIAGREPYPSTDGIAVGCLANQLINETLGLKNVFVEIKPQSVALHFRPSLVEPAEALRVMERVLAHAQGDFRILQGKNVFEAVGRNTGKDVAVSRFLRELPYLGRIPVFVGDDVTDEAAFQEVNRRSGVSIRVGLYGDTSAQFRIANVAAAAVWLRDVLLPQLCHISPKAPQRKYLELL